MPFQIFQRHANKNKARTFKNSGVWVSTKDIRHRYITYFRRLQPKRVAPSQVILFCLLSVSLHLLRPLQSHYRSQERMPTKDQQSGFFLVINKKLYKDLSMYSLAMGHSLFHILFGRDAKNNMVPIFLLPGGYVKFNQSFCFVACSIFLSEWRHQRGC